jgi:hypothetical protein
MEYFKGIGVLPNSVTPAPKLYYAIRQHPDCDPTPISVPHSPLLLGDKIRQIFQLDRQVHVVDHHMGRHLQD